MRAGRVRSGALAWLGTGYRVVAGATQAGAAQAKPPRDPLERARLLYNERQYDAALTATEEARRQPTRADSADLIAARIYLERYRAGHAEEDLASARQRLRDLDPAKFIARERLEFVVGLAETLYLDHASGAAATLFESVLPSRADQIGRAHV